MKMKNAANLFCLSLFFLLIFSRLTAFGDCAFDSDNHFSLEEQKAAVLIEITKTAIVKDTLPELRKKKIENEENEDFDLSFDRIFAKATETKKEIPNEYENTYVPETEVKVDSTHMQLKKIPALYTGYKVEIMASKEKLNADHRIFTQHGNIYEEQKQDGSFSYLLGDFETREAAESFLNEFLAGRYPEAKVVSYKEGTRQPS